MAIIDLHIHSCHSDDGEYTPGELLAMAKTAGLRVFSLADHNTTSGVDEAVEAGREQGIDIIPAIELDCGYKDLSLHVLGYGIAHRDPRYRRISEDVSSQEEDASLKRMERVRKLGIAVDGDQAFAKARHGILTAELIAEVALANPANAENSLLAPYRPGGSRGNNPWVNFYWDYCAPGKPAHVPIRFMTLDQALELILDTGGVPVLAHPGPVLKGGADRLPDLVDKGIKGVEAFSSYHSAEACAFWNEQATRNTIFVTCGSDFHGKTKPSIQLGCHGGDAHETEALAFLQGAGLGGQT